MKKSVKPKKRYTYNPDIKAPLDLKIFVFIFPFLYIISNLYFLGKMSENPFIDVDLTSTVMNIGTLGVILSLVFIYKMKNYGVIAFIFFMYFSYYGAFVLSIPVEQHFGWLISIPSIYAFIRVSKILDVKPNVTIKQLIAYATITVTTFLVVRITVNNQISNLGEEVSQIKTQHHSVKDYSFHKSKLWENSKNFEHNIFGFRMDIPNDWTFTVVGSDDENGAVLIYPEELQTNKISEGYKSISIFNYNHLLKRGMKVELLARNILKGKEIIKGTENAFYENIEIINDCNETKLNDIEAVQFKIKLNTKTGFKVIEDFYLVNNNNELRALSIIYEESINKNQLEFIYKLADSFEIIEQ